MPDETTPATPPAGDAAPIQTPAQAATSTTPEPQAGDGQETISLEEARKLRKEAQSLRQRLKGFEDAEEQAKLAALSDVDKATKRANDAEQRIKQYQERLVLAEVKMAAQAKGIIDPDLAALAIRDKLEFGDDGMPSNLEKTLDALIKNKPYLVPKLAEPPAPSEPPVTPATSAAVPPAPALPAMNPGRTTIQPPGTATPGKIPSWGEVYKRPQ